ncbi:pentapeptide repeat-containing protein [Vibrio sp. WXL103]|uniref:pentapeptide repeat-containing protein n=1 Tax=Vibrio sp. WXL103 TaxID=3450710 RepID=UPI003EC78B96
MKNTESKLLKNTLSIKRKVRFIPILTVRFSRSWWAKLFSGFFMMFTFFSIILAFSSYFSQRDDKKEERISQNLQLLSERSNYVNGDLIWNTIFFLVKNNQPIRYFNFSQIENSKGGVLEGPIMEYNDFSSSIINDLNIINGGFANSNFIHSSIWSVKFIGDAYWKSCALKTAKIGSGCYANGTNFNDLRYSSFFGANIDDSIMSEVLLPYANFSYSSIYRTSFSRSNLGWAVFNGAILTGVNFSNSYLKGASFHGSKIESTSFQSAFLDNASFLNVELGDNVSFKGVELENVYFYFDSNATINCKVFEGAYFKGKYINSDEWDCKKAFNRTELDRSNITSCKENKCDYDKLNVSIKSLRNLNDFEEYQATRINAGLYVVDEQMINSHLNFYSIGGLLYYAMKVNTPLGNCTSFGYVRHSKTYREVTYPTCDIKNVTYYLDVVSDEVEFYGSPTLGLRSFDELAER